MKKRIASIVLALCVLLSLCSCGQYSSIKVNGTKIAKGVYNYFLDRATVGNPDADKATIEADANNRVIRYVAVNSEFQNRSLTLDAQERDSVSDNTNSYWRLFSDYYEKHGVAKQDLYLIELNKAYESKLLKTYYSENGDSPVSKEELRAYFNKNFIGFRAITGSLSSAADDEARRNVIGVFEHMASDINHGNGTLDSVSSYTVNVTVMDEIKIISKTTLGYPEQFYTDLATLEVDKANTFIIGDSIFTVQRYSVEPQEGSEDLFVSYRDKCLQELKEEEFHAVVDTWASNYSIG